MASYSFIVLCLISVTTLCSTMKIGYSRPSMSLQGGEILLKTTEINPKTVGSCNLVTMKVIYDKEKIELESVSDFQNLQIFEMEIKQDYPPEFKNLPSIKAINLQKVGIFYIKKGIFSDIPVEHVHLGFNQIASIEKSSFGSRVKMLNLMCNNLETFKPHWFVNMSSLEVLNMDGNLFTTIEQYLFLPMHSLKVLDLRYNHMKSIRRGAFSNTAHYYRLDLSHNNLVEIGSNILTDAIIQIDVFAINSNNLTYLSPDFLNKIIVRGSLMLDDNPWQCKCWENMKQWISDTQKFINSTSSCVHPVHNYYMMGYPDSCLQIVDTKLIEIFTSTYMRPSNDKHLYCINLS